MKIDFHIHLEEGPYTNNFFNKTVNAMEAVNKINKDQYTLDAMNQKAELFHLRMKEGDYSEYWLDYYLRTAVQKGLKYVGIVDHLYRFEETRDYFTKYIQTGDKVIDAQQLKWLDEVMTHRLKDFTQFINAQKAKWQAQGVTLLLGIEADYFEDGEAELKALLEPYTFDYIIGSVHFNNGWGFDNPELKHMFEDKDLMQLYRSHFETVKQAARSGIFSFIAHLDNLKVFGNRPDEALLLPMYEEVALALSETNTATEVNVGLKYRYPVKEQCPSEAFIKVLSAHQIDFTTSSDSHFPNDIGIFNDEMIQLLKSNGINKIVRFENMNKYYETI